MNRFATLALAMVVAPAAFAQFSDNIIPTNLDLRVGFVYPTERATRSVTGNMLAIGFNLNTNVQLIRGHSGFFSLDYMSGSLNGDNGYFLPVMYNQRFNLGQNIAERQSYFFVGAGMVNVDVVRAKFVFGARGGVGVNLSENTFAEATFLWSEAVDGTRANSLGIYAGFRF